MSVDLSYHAFSPSLADKNWEHFPEDILLLRKKYQTEKEYKKQQEELDRPEREKHEAKIAKFEEALAKKRKEIFKRYEDEGLYIPETDWQQDGPAMINGVWGPYYPTDKEKIEYLLNFGPLYPKGYAKGGTVAGKLMYVEDKEEYQVLEHEKGEVEAERWEKIMKGPKAVKPPEVVLNEQQKKLYSVTDYLFAGDTYNKIELLSTLKFVDLSYGSITADLPERGTDYDAVLESFNLVSDHGNLVVIAEVWFDLYNKLDNRLISERAAEMQKIEIAADLSLEECEWYIRDFFVGMKPLVKFLKDNSDAVLLRDFSTGSSLDPKIVDNIFVERAKKAAQKYKGLIPPVL